MRGVMFVMFINNPPAAPVTSLGGGRMRVARVAAPAPRKGWCNGRKPPRSSRSIMHLLKTSSLSVYRYDRL